jgi:hypothetical protein
MENIFIKKTDLNNLDTHNPNPNNQDTHNPDPDKLSLVCDVNYSADRHGGVKCYVTMAQHHPPPASSHPYSPLFRTILKSTPPYQVHNIHTPVHNILLKIQIRTIEKRTIQIGTNRI